MGSNQYCNERHQNKTKQKVSIDRPADGPVPTTPQDSEIASVPFPLEFITSITSIGDWRWMAMLIYCLLLFSYFDFYG